MSVDQNGVTAEDDADQDVDAEALANDATKTAQRALRKVNEIESELDDVRDENQQLRQQISELENRTALLDLVARDGDTVDDRAVVLLQNLFNEAYQEKQRAHLENVTPSASLDYNGAKRALGGQTTARQQLYDAMQRAVELVYGSDVDPESPPEDQPVVQYVTEDRTSERNTRLVVDLSETDAIELTNGRRLTAPDEEGQ